MKRVEIIVQGIVQGVLFRIFTQDNARRLGLKGWVRNEDYDKVHIMAEGEESAIKELVQLTRKGPHSADVRDQEVNYPPYTGEFKFFSIKS